MFRLLWYLFIFCAYQFLEHWGGRFVMIDMNKVFRKWAILGITHYQRWVTKYKLIVCWNEYVNNNLIEDILFYWVSPSNTSPNYFYSCIKSLSTYLKSMNVFWRVLIIVRLLYSGQLHKLNLYAVSLIELFLMKRTWNYFFCGNMYYLFQKNEQGERLIVSKKT